MLYDIHGKKQSRIIHRGDYNQWRTNLSDSDWEGIVAAVHEVMDRDGVFKSSYLPGSDWNGTPYLPIWFAVGEDFDQARLFFGLLVWEAVWLHPEDWYFVRQDSPGDEPTGMTYFRRQA
ncbi:MAG: hypothetical protein ABIK83_07755 [Candidatus Zixiibacteriota bacterium]